MDKFIELLKESVITQGVLTVGLAGVYAYLLIIQAPIPQNLETILGVIVGFYFGGKVPIAATRIASEIQKAQAPTRK